MDKLRYGGPVVLAILDGVGLAPDGPGNAVSKAKTPFLGRASKNYLHLSLDASGEAVGLVNGQMGNSEVGHNTIGSGQVIKQGIARIEEAFNTGEVFNSSAWRGAITRVSGETGPTTLHFAGIFSDGGVHSHVSHLGRMIDQAYKEGVRKIRVHAIFDGRDVAPQSEPKYVEAFNEFASRYPDADIQIASGGGRQTTVADRYGNDWSVVERGFKMMVEGKAENYFRSALEAISSLRRKNPKIQDQDLPAFVIVDSDEKPVGKINRGDALIYFDFRADRAVEIAEAFTYFDFDKFDRGDYSPVDVYFVGMTEYDSDTHVPEYRLVKPVKIEKTLNQFLGQKGISQFAISETVKFGHITYYFNGNSYKQALGEEHVEVESYPDSFETRPWMRSAEITDEVIKGMDEFKFIRLNFPGGDMVGHTSDFNATTIAMEAIDLSLARIAEAVDKKGGVLIITADHGNAEELTSKDGEKKTAHTTNRVPCIIYDNTSNQEKYKLANLENPGLANITSTIAVLLGQDDYPEDWDRPLISVL